MIEPRQRARPLAEHARAPARRRAIRRHRRRARTPPMPRSCSARVDYADAAKDVNPAAQIFGPVNYGWQGMIRFQDARRCQQPRLPQFLPAADGGGGEHRPGIACSTCSTCTGTRRRAAPARQPDGRLPHHRRQQRGGGRRRAQAGAAQPLGSDVHRDQLDHAVLLGRRRSACCRGSRTRSPLTTRARSWRSPNTTTAARITSPAPSRRPTCSASSAAKGCSPPRCGALAVEQQLHLRRLRDASATTTARTAASATPASARPTATRQRFGVRQRECGQCRAHGDRGINKADSAQTAGIAVTHTAQFHTAQVYQLTSANSVPQRRRRHQHHADQRVPVLDAGQQRDDAGAAAVSQRNYEHAKRCGYARDSFD